MKMLIRPTQSDEAMTALSPPFLLKRAFNPL